MVPIFEPWEVRGGLGEGVGGAMGCDMDAETEGKGEQKLSEQWFAEGRRRWSEEEVGPGRR